MARVLIVEDDKFLNKLLSDRFILEGFEVESVLDGESACNLLEATQDTERNFDILLSDMLLPRMMGAEIFAKVHELNLAKNLRMIAMSGIYKNPSDIEELTKLYRLEGYWTKPFEFNELVATITGKPSTHGKQQELTEGILINRSVERLFLDAYQSGFTGKLIIKREGSERRLYFSNGFPVSADSTAISESFGRSLLSLGLITQEILDDASKRMVQEKIQFGQMLIKMGALTKEALFSALRKHTYRILVNTVAWRDGLYEFLSLKELPSYVLALEFNSILMMMRAHKSLYSASFLKSLFATKSDFYCQFSKQTFQILPLFNLDEGSIRFFQNLSGSQPLNEILKPIPSANHETLFRVFFLLESLHLVEWKTSAITDRQPDVPTADFKSNFEAEAESSEEISKSLQAEYMDLLNKDYFDILEATPDSSDADIDDSYRAIRYRLHPDRFGDKIGGQTKRILDDMLGRIDRAYQTLMDPEAKAAYLVSIQRLKQDSFADSKRFLEAQDLFREGLRHLTGQDFDKAKSVFELAHTKWDRGIEYRLYVHFADFKKKMAAGDKAAAEKLVQLLKNGAAQNRTIDTGYLLLGHAYHAMEKADLAKEAYQIALKNNDKNEEAAHALARLGDANLRKMQFSRAVQTSKAGLKGVVITAVLIGAIATLYFERQRSMREEEGIQSIDFKEIEGIAPAISFRQKGQIAKIVFREKWLNEVPDPVLNSKCVELLNQYKSRAILEIYLFDEKAGLKAYCRGQTLRRY